MQQLFPTPNPAPDLLALLDRGDRLMQSGRPWVMANMVTSIDGAYSVDDRSGGLSSPDDRAVFHTLRAACDIVLVAAGTARTENYRRPTTGDATLLAARRAAGLPDAPRLCVVSRSLELAADLPLRSGPGEVPLVLHPERPGASCGSGVELRAAGTPEIDLAGALVDLHEVDGAQVVLCEGGPTLLGQLQRAGLVDELFLTLAPLLVGGDRTGLLGHVPAAAASMRLHRVLEANGSLMLTYRRI